MAGKRRSTRGSEGFRRRVIAIGTGNIHSRNPRIEEEPFSKRAAKLVNTILAATPKQHALKQSAMQTLMELAGNAEREIEFSRERIGERAAKSGIGAEDRKELQELDANQAKIDLMKAIAAGSNPTDTNVKILVKRVNELEKKRPV
ncbi:MAG: hypothetical protein JW744_00150 [Candidatus Diapherotrites archaeon]|uniref:Uncharacterized protein n=1 Tax=Candidatus Iainarchaeum sp. TaxID=3101447 RepID=A0A938YVI0_9ARCH|nr:hypothetical protein [Candidatus Diapherotrites archaeon]